MTNFNTELIEALAQGIDITEIFRSQLEEAMNLLLETERTAFLGFEHYDKSGYNSGNSRNGYYDRTLKSKYGVLNLKIPRDRNGLFSQKTITSFSESNDTLEDTIKLFYKNGLTTRDISEMIEKMYGQYYSPQTISNLSESILEELELFKNKKINSRYAVIYCDATFIPVRRDTVSKEAVHVIIGITEEGYKEVLSFAVYPIESASNYREMLQDLKSRGLEDVIVFISDELTGLKDTLTDEFPLSKHQSCWTHILRNIANKVRANDKSSVLEDLKEVYKKETIEEAKLSLEDFFSKYSSKYPKVKESLENKENLFTYLEFPKSIRSSIYTNNISETFNKQLKRKAKVKEQFPHETSLEKYVYTYVSKYNTKFSSRIHKGFGLAQYELSKMLDEMQQKRQSKNTSSHILDEVTNTVELSI